MPQLTSAEKTNIAFKMVFGVQGLSNTDDTAGLSWYEEQYAWRPFLLNDDLYVESVPWTDTKAEADTAVSNNPGVIEKIDIKLTEVTGTNGRGWAAFQTYNDPDSGLLGDWLIPQIFGTGYALQLFQDDGTGTAPGTEITTTEGAWVPSYKLGFIILGTGHTVADEGWTGPLWVRVYRYIGAVGVSGGTLPGLTLDSVYNGGSVISVDSGPVTFNASNDYASMQITPIAYTPTTGVASGQIINRNGVVYSYDGTRSKWLSIDQPILSYQARLGDANYLSTGDHSDINSGFTAVRDGTIIGVSASGGSGNQTKAFAIRINGVLTDLSTFALTAGKHNDDTLDLDFSAGDVIQIYTSADGPPVFSPRVNLIIAWRV